MLVNEQKKKHRECVHLDGVQTLKSFASHGSVFKGLHDESITNVLTAFRDLCAVVWMLASRDSLSLALRKKASAVKQQVHVLIFLPINIVALSLFSVPDSQELLRVMLLPSVL